MDISFVGFVNVCLLDLGQIGLSPELNKQIAWVRLLFRARFCVILSRNCREHGGLQHRYSVIIVNRSHVVDMQKDNTLIRLCLKKLSVPVCITKASRQLQDKHYLLPQTNTLSTFPSQNFSNKRKCVHNHSNPLIAIPDDATWLNNSKLQFSPLITSQPTFFHIPSATPAIFTILFVKSFARS